MNAAAIPRASLTAPAAITGTFTASTICGTSAKVPTWAARSSDRNMPRWPPASKPCAIIDVDAVRLEPARLGDRGGGGHGHAAERLDPPEQVRRRQAEMEAHDLGLRLLDHRAERRVERHAHAGRHRRRRIDAELLVVGLEPLAPARLARVVELRRRVAEEIEVDRLVRARTVFRDLVARLLGVEHRERQRRQAARLRHRDREFEIHRARHRREHDRMLDLEEVEKTAVRPHVGLYCIVPAIAHSQCEKPGFVTSSGHIASLHRFVYIAWPMPRMRRAIAPMM